MGERFRCTTCGAELVQKPAWKLGLAALLMLATCTVLFHYVRGFRFIGVTLGLAGCYLVAWAMIGKGRWCRNCKRFPLA